jgi:hypothetical protein
MTYCEGLAEDGEVGDGKENLPLLDVVVIGTSPVYKDWKHR